MGNSADTPLTAGELCPDLAARRVNYFSGRLVKADDLRQEQAAISQRDRWLGIALGAGVAHGFEVQPVKGSPALLKLTAGLAINGEGEPLALDHPMQLRLAPAIEKSGAGGFAPCGSEAGFVADKGEGYYLVSVAPSVGLSAEKAQEIGRDGQVIACGARWRLEGISFGIDKIPAAALPAALRTPPPTADARALSRARSQLAALCLGPALAAGSDPFAAPGGDLLTVSGLADSQRVPLALVAWTVQGVAFVDRWAVRRSPAPAAELPYWPPGRARAAQAEAMARQFQEHLAELVDTLAADAIKLVAGDAFAWLPPVGVLPGAHGKQPGITPQIFLRELPARPLFVARAALEALLRDGRAYPPIPLAQPQPELVWISRLVEDPDIYIFASGHLPPPNPARFDLARYDAAFFPDGELALK